MLKRLVQLLLEFGAGLAGNLAAGWIQQDVWSNLFTPTRLLGTLAGAGVMLLILAWLESERALPWNWRWHRYWYLCELLENPDLRRWETDFARLELAQGRRKVSGVEVMAERERRDLIEVLCDLIAGRQGEVRRALVLGEPGSGKTTGLERLTLELAREGAWRLGFDHPMPILVRLGNYQRGELLEYVGQAMRHGARGGSGKVLGKGIEDLIEQGHVVLLFDALDEALGARREEVLAELGNFLGSRAYEHTPVVITSRTREDPVGRLRGLPMFEIQDLRDEAVEVLIRAYEQPEHSEEVIRERLERHSLLEPGGLGRNPFWLQLIMETGAFEGNKGRILNQAVDTLLAREWDEKPVAGRSWQRVLPRGDQLEETKRGLAWLGYRMVVEKQIAFGWDVAVAELAKWLDGRVGVEGLRPQDVLGLGRDAQVLVYEPDPIRFRHRLLQELMAAWALTVECGLLTPAFVEQCVPDTDWWETLLMLGSLIQDQSALVRDVLGDSRDVQRLFLAMGLLGTVGEPDKELKRQMTEALAESLRGGVTPKHRQVAWKLARIAGDGVVEAFGELLRKGDRKVREGAVEILKEIGNRKAAQVLISSLGDKAIEGQVAKALVSIGQPAMKPLLEVLRRYENSGVRLPMIEFLRSIGDEHVEELPRVALLAKFETCLAQWRAAEILGQIREPAVGILIEALRSEDFWVQLVAVAGLRNIGESAVMPLLEAMCSEDGEVRRAAVDALGQIGDRRAVEPIIQALADKSVPVRLEAALALGHIGDRRAVEPLIGALRDKDSWVRRGAAEALGKIGNPRALPYLEQVTRRKDKKAAGAAREAIKRITAMQRKKVGEEDE